MARSLQELAAGERLRLDVDIHEHRTACHCFHHRDRLSSATEELSIHIPLLSYVDSFLRLPIHQSNLVPISALSLEPPDSPK